jgi:hypothetical protein
VKTTNHNPTRAYRRIATEEALSISGCSKATCKDERPDPARLTTFMTAHACRIHKTAKAADREGYLLGELRRVYGVHICELRNQPACIADHASRMLDQLRRTYETLALGERRQVQAFIREISAAMPSQGAADVNPADAG